MAAIRVTSTWTRLVAGLFLGWMLVLWAILAIPFTLTIGALVGLKRLFAQAARRLA